MKKTISRKRSAQPKKIESGYFLAKDGARLYYEAEGRGPPIVFCYGLVCNMRSFRHQRARLAKQYRCIFFDYRGHGRSMAVQPSRQDALEKAADDVVALLDHLRIRQTAIVGHSYGVNVGLYLGLRHATRVSCMVWIDGMLDRPLDTIFRKPYAYYIFQIMQWMYLHYPKTFATCWELGFGAEWLSYLSIVPLGFNLMLAKDWDVQNYVEGVARTPYTTFMEMMMQLSELESSHLVSRLRGIPVLVCAGTEDHVTPVELQHVIAQRLPQGKFAMVLDATHNAHLEKPREVNRLIEKWLAQYGD